MNAAVDAARAYDRWFDQPWGRYAFTVERQALLTALGPVGGCHILDVGCGTARFTVELERAGGDVVGVDRDAGMLTVAADRLSGPVVRADAPPAPLRRRLPRRDRRCDDAGVHGSARADRR